MSTAPPFKVKAIFEYDSPHEDDLKFSVNQIITVTEEEDADWYIGEYTDASGEQKSGLFPKNFVERYEPVAPPRPTRAARPKQAEPPPPAESVPESLHPQSPPKPIEPEKQAGFTDRSTSGKPPVTEPRPDAANLEHTTQSASSPPLKKAPPPVAEKSSSFRDRIAAFNKQAAPPIAPFKPGGVAAASTFIKKPFVAPPPARDAYVPPPREPAPQKVYRREEDPEIAEQQSQDQENAERAGLAVSGGNEEEEVPKAVSLKERIALLQKQQMEQAARRAEHANKDKTKRPSKKRTDSYENGEDRPNESLDNDGSGPPQRDSAESGRSAGGRRPSKSMKSPEELPKDRELFSDTNDADQSAAGDTTEDAEAGDTSVEEDDRKRHGKAPTRSEQQSHSTRGEHAEEAEEEEGEEEEEQDEEELDEETRHQMALRERMAKLSGGMGMGAMFGPPGGLAMPGIGGMAKKKKPTLEKRYTNEAEETTTDPPQRMPMVPIPGMGRMLSPASTDPAVTKEDEEENHPVSGVRGPEVIPDIEDVKPTSPRDERTVPPLTPQAPSVSRTTTDHAPPPIPGERPGVTAARPVPPPPPAQLQGESEGSESGDEMPDNEDEQTEPLKGSAPPVPSRDLPQSPTLGRLSDTWAPPPIPARDTAQPLPSGPQTGDKRASRVPPIPLASPAVSNASSAARPPPPPPPGTAPSRSMTSDSLHKRVVTGEGESEYEGDYDTDIGSSAKYKDALKSHNREESVEDSTATDEASLRSPHALPPSGYTSPVAGGVPIPGAILRAAPPPPPAQPPSRKSMEAPRAPPPIPPGAADDEDYDPYRYTQPPSVRSPPAAPRPVPQVPPMSPKLPSQASRSAGYEREEGEGEEGSESEEDQLVSPPPRRSTDRPPPPPPTHAPPHAAAPPVIAPPQTPTQNQPPLRQSTEADRGFGTQNRRSMEQQQGSMQGDQGFIARDVDLSPTSMWWTQPNTPPPVFQNRNDVLFEIEDNSTSRRGGHISVTRDVYVVFPDYSRTTVTARFDSKSPQDVILEQHHEPPPPKPRQDELESVYHSNGAQIAQHLKALENVVAGDGTPQALIYEALSRLEGPLMPVGVRAYGALVYANLANASVQQFDEIRPGDIVTFRNAKFHGKHGAMHAKYSADVGKPDHVGIVTDWDGTKKKIRALEQGREGVGKKAKVESFRLGDLRSGEVRVWRIMQRSWVGW